MKFRTAPLRRLVPLELIKPIQSPVPVRLSISTGSGSRSLLPNSSLISNTKSIQASVKTSAVSVQSSPMAVKIPPLAMKTSSKSTTTISIKPFGSNKSNSKRTQEYIENSEERPRKIVKLKTADIYKITEIQSRTPNPAPARGRNSLKGPTPTSKTSPKSNENTISKTSSQTTAFPGLATPSSASNTKIRKPLPDARKPLPSGSAGRKQTAFGPPRTPLPTPISAELPPAKKGFVLKLKSGGFKGKTTRPNPQQ